MAWLALVALAITLPAGGCGGRSLPAATHTAAPNASDLNASSTGNPVGNPPAGKTNAVPTGSAPVPAAPQATTAVAARRQPIRNITFDTVKLNLNKGDPYHSDLLTPAVKQLDGSRVRIRGFILPPPQQTGLTRFVLVRDNLACCFGPGAAIYDSMIIQMKKDLSIDYTVQPIMVEGTFNIHEVHTPDGRCLSIYHLTADKAQ
jgi:hypothetical protein